MTATNDTNTTGKMADFVHAKPFDVSALSNAVNMSAGSIEISDSAVDAQFHRGLTSPPIHLPLQHNGLGLVGSGNDLTSMMHANQNHNQKCLPLPNGFLSGQPAPSTIHSSIASSNSSHPDLSMFAPGSQTHSPAVFSPQHPVPAAAAVGAARHAVSTAWSAGSDATTSPMLFNSSPQHVSPLQNTTSGLNGSAAAGGVMALAGMLTLPQRCIPPHTSAPGSYYEHLNVKRTATRADIDAAYRRWRNGGYRKAQSIDPVRADTLDRVIIEATLVLSNEGFRTQYDNYLN